MTNQPVDMNVDINLYRTLNDNELHHLTRELDWQAQELANVTVKYCSINGRR